MSVLTKLFEAILAFPDTIVLVFFIRVVFCLLIILLRIVLIGVFVHYYEVELKEAIKFSTKIASFEIDSK